MDDDQDQRPESLLPYERWTMEAMRQVVVRALAHVAAEGLPGEHHFYLTFRTDHPGVNMPARLRTQYPHEMTIVLQHQFHDLRVDEAAGMMSVGLSFGGVPATLAIPLAAVTAFADPYARFGIRFETEAPPAAEPEPSAAPPPTYAAEEEREAAVEAEEGEEAEKEKEKAVPQVVSLDAFRRRTPLKE